MRSLLLTACLLLAPSPAAALQPPPPQPAAGRTEAREASAPVPVSRTEREGDVLLPERERALGDQSGLGVRRSRALPLHRASRPASATGPRGSAGSGSSSSASTLSSSPCSTSSSTCRSATTRAMPASTPTACRTRPSASGSATRSRVWSVSWSAGCLLLWIPYLLLNGARGAGGSTRGCSRSRSSSS